MKELNAESMTYLQVACGSDIISHPFYVPLAQFLVADEQEMNLQLLKRSYEVVPYVQHSRSGNTAVRVQELEFSLEFPGGTRPRFKHIMEEMRNNFPDREHVGYKLYTLMKWN